MISAEMLISTKKYDLPALSKELDASDLDALVGWLSEKYEEIRYHSLLLLQNRAKDSGDLYKYWDIFIDKLKNENSYQRSIGLIMIASNVKWDKDNRFEDSFNEFCALLNDEKPITVRQCIQSFELIVPYKPQLCPEIAETLMGVDILNAKETMRKLFLLDIIDILLFIRKQGKTDEIEKYISDALLGGILNSKSKKAVQTQLLSSLQ